MAWPSRLETVTIDSPPRSSSVAIVCRGSYKRCEMSIPAASSSGLKWRRTRLPWWMTPCVVLGRLARLGRLRVFDAVGEPMRYKALLQPGQVSVVDPSDTDSPALSNLVIADVLRGVQETP